MDRNKVSRENGAKKVEKSFQKWEGEEDNKVATRSIAEFQAASFRPTAKGQAGSPRSGTAAFFYAGLRLSPNLVAHLAKIHAHKT
jgi:hypothetical protein